MDHFELVSEYAPTGDQPQAIENEVRQLDDARKALADLKNQLAQKRADEAELRAQFRGEHAPRRARPCPAASAPRSLLTAPQRMCIQHATPSRGSTAPKSTPRTSATRARRPPSACPVRTDSPRPP